MECETNLHGQAPFAVTAPGANPLVSVVLPCLNEAGSVARVVADALTVMRQAGIHGEVVVADNGSIDGSAELAAGAGAHVVVAAQRGYGNAYHAGMAAARGRVLVMADADGTYPMEAIPGLVAPILTGERDMVIGSRLRGAIAGGAMPWSHRYIGNPVLTRLLNRFFGVTVSDAHSGMRAIDAAVYRRLRLATPGMEYASEMIVQAARARIRMVEVPIEYRERIGESKLQTWPDGWRHLKFLLLAAPNWLFLLPGALSLVLGLLLLVPLTFGPVHVWRINLVLHPMMAGSALTIVGFQMLELGTLVRACSSTPEGVRDRLGDFVHRHLTIERSLIAGVAIFLFGLGIGVAIAVQWAVSGFGELNDIRLAITAMTVTLVGTQTIAGAFLYAFFLPARFGGGVARLERGGLDGGPLLVRGRTSRSPVDAEDQSLVSAASTDPVA